MVVASVLDFVVVVAVIVVVDVVAAAVVDAVVVTIVLAIVVVLVVVIVVLVVAIVMVVYGALPMPAVLQPEAGWVTLVCAFLLDCCCDSSSLGLWSSWTILWLWW